MSIKATVNPAADTAEITKEELIADAREHETSLLDGRFQDRRGLH